MECETPQPVASTPAPQAGQDVSQRTIVVLVILTLAVTFIGAWAGISATTNLPQPAQAHANQAAPAHAEVSFTVKKPEVKRDTAAGMATFEIKP